MQPRHVAIYAAMIGLVQPGLAQGDGSSFLEHIAAARRAAETCPRLRVNEQRIAELMGALGMPQSLMAKAHDETDMALILPPSPEPGEQPSASATPSRPAVNPLCRIALADYGPGGVKLADLLEAVPPDAPQ